MAVSGTVSTTTFNTRRVIDTAFRNCRLPAQKITSEMQNYAQDALYLLLSGLANPKPPSWCIDSVILPMYQNVPAVTLPTGTVEALNVNYRQTSEASGTVVDLGTSYTVNFTGADSDAYVVNTVGVKWSAASVALTFYTSDDGATWTQVGTQTTTAASGEWTWTDISAATAHTYFKITAASTINYTQIYLGTSPQEIPLGVLNRDIYSAQSNKVFPGRPSTFWQQRLRAAPVLNLWPAPNLAAETAQLVVWRHRHVMDVGTLAEEIEVPQRWMEAISLDLAARLAQQSPEVDPSLIPILDQKATRAMSEAWAGDNDGSSTFVTPRIGVYTR